VLQDLGDVPRLARGHSLPAVSRNPGDRALIRDALRPDLVLHDASLAFELVAAIKLADPKRTTELRHRYLALILDGMRATDRGELPGPPPGWQELSDRWSPAQRAR
jgi:hypothetical protein